MKKTRYLIEAATLYLLFGVFRILPLNAASAFGGWLGKTIGPRLAASRKADRNLRLALPGKSEAEYKLIIAGMWENLGRVTGEFPHLNTIVRERTSTTGDQLVRASQEAGKPVMLFGGHLGNWEVPGQYVATCIGPMATIYREPNNPWSATLLRKMRRERHELQFIPKSNVSTRPILRALREGRHVGLLIDQKYNPGIPVPFFGIPAMTSTAFAQLAQKMEVPLIPTRLERVKGAHFQLTFMKPVPTHDESGSPRPAEDIILETHQILENWISERPEQWLWLHRRWPES